MGITFAFKEMCCDKKKCLFSSRSCVTVFKILIYMIAKCIPMFELINLTYTGSHKTIRLPATTQPPVHNFK